MGAVRKMHERVRDSIVMRFATHLGWSDAQIDAARAAYDAMPRSGFYADGRKIDVAAIVSTAAGTPCTWDDVTPVEYRR